MSTSSKIINAVSAVRELWEEIIYALRTPHKIANTATPEQRARRRVQTLMDFNDGLFEDYLHYQINQNFRGWRARQAMSQLMETDNLVKFLSTTVAGYCFREGVLVQADNETDQSIYNDIMDFNEFDEMVKRLDQSVYLYKTMFIRVAHVPTSGQIKLDFITPDLVKVKTSPYDRDEIVEVIYFTGNDRLDITKPQGTFAKWTKTSFTYVDQDGNELPNPENPSGINPYGVIPIIAFRESKPLFGSFIQWPGEDLVNAQETINLLLTFKNWLTKLCSVPTPHGHNLKIENDSEIILDGSTMIQTRSEALDGGTGLFEWVTPKSNLKELLEVINYKIRNLMISQGIDPNLYNASADRQSGSSVIAMGGKLEERRQIVRLGYQYGLEKMFDLIKVVYNTHHSDALLTGDSPEIQIPEPKRWYNTAADKIADYTFQLQNDLTTKAQILLLERGDLNNITEAERIVADNAKANRQSKLVNLLATPAVPPAPQDQSSSNQA